MDFWATLESPEDRWLGQLMTLDEDSIDDFSELAAIFEQTPIVRRPALVELKDEGLTALHRASKAGKRATVQWLVERAGADVEATDDLTRSTPLQWACAQNRPKVAEYLLEQARVRYDAVNRDGKTALQLASEKKATALFAYLVRFIRRVEREQRIARQADASSASAHTHNAAASPAIAHTHNAVVATPQRARATTRARTHWQTPVEEVATPSSNTEARLIALETALQRVLQDQKLMHHKIEQLQAANFDLDRQLQEANAFRAAVMLQAQGTQAQLRAAAGNLMSIADGFAQVIPAPATLAPSCSPKDPSSPAANNGKRRGRRYPPF